MELGVVTGGLKLGDWCWGQVMPYSQFELKGNVVLGKSGPHVFTVTRQLWLEQRASVLTFLSLHLELMQGLELTKNIVVYLRHSHGTLWTLRDDAWDTRDSLIKRMGHSHGTLLVHCKGVTRMSQHCHMDVTTVLQHCWRGMIWVTGGITTMSQFCQGGHGCKNCVTEQSQQCHRTVAELSQQCYIQLCHRDVTAVSQHNQAV